MSTELEQLFNATAVQPGRPVDLSLVTGRIARRRQARLSATFAGALAAAAFAFSMVGDTLPTSAPIVGEVPEVERVPERESSPVRNPELAFAGAASEGPDVGAGTRPSATPPAQAPMAAIEAGPGAVNAGDAEESPAAAGGQQTWQFEGSMDSWRERPSLAVSANCAYAGGAGVTWSASDDRYGRLGLAFSALGERCRSVAVDTNMRHGVRSGRIVMTYRWAAHATAQEGMTVALTPDVGWGQRTVIGRVKPDLTGEWREWSAAISLAPISGSGSYRLWLRPEAVPGQFCAKTDCDQAFVVDEIHLTWDASVPS